VTKERLTIFDTTLRDGAQTQGVDFSVEDKRQIALALDTLGVDYIEGGWPGANPTDTAFFSAPPPLKKARFTAFGMTKRSGRSAANDPGLSAILDAKADAACLVGKTWDFHVDVALEIHAPRTSWQLRNRSRRWWRRSARHCSMRNTSSTVTRRIHSMRSTASARRWRRARTGSSCATPTAAACRMTSIASCQR